MHDLATDLNDNILISYYFQNRIEKYSPIGNLIFKADRQLNFEIAEDERKYSGETPQGIIEWTSAALTRVSGNIEIDSSNRIWINTYNKPIIDDNFSVEDIDFEVYNKEGILLTKVPRPENSGNFRIFDNKLYFIHDYYISEYKIIDNDIIGK
ncbi:hypothetical protein ACFL4Q_01355 [candidate division KSB1 bacterium]